MGTVRLTILRNNVVVVEEVGYNVVLRKGLEQAVDRLKPTPTENAMQYIAIGTNNDTTTSDQQTLVTEVARKLCLVTSTGNVLKYDVQWPSGSGLAGKTIYEIGLFNSPSTGTMFARRVTIGHLLGASDGLHVEWDFEISVS